MFYNICHVILYDMFKTEPNRTCYITCVILCYLTCHVMLFNICLVMLYNMCRQVMLYNVILCYITCVM